MKVTAVMEGEGAVTIISVVPSGGDICITYVNASSEVKVKKVSSVNMMGGNNNIIIATAATVIS